MHITHSIDSIPDITLPTSESGPPEKPPPPRPGPPPPRPGPPPSRPAQPPSRPAAPPSRPKQPPSRPVVPPSPKRPPVPEQQPTDLLEKSSEMKDEPEKPMHAPPPGTSTYLCSLQMYNYCYIYIILGSYSKMDTKSISLRIPIQIPSMQSMTSLDTIDVSAPVQT